MKIRQTKTDFTAGFLSFSLYGRSDLEVFSKGLADARNCKIGVLGGVSNLKLQKVEVGTYTKEGTPTNPVNRMAIKTGDTTFVLKEGTLEKDGKVFKQIITEDLSVSTIESTGTKEKVSDQPPREAKEDKLANDRGFRYDVRDMYFSIEKIGDETPPSQVVVYSGIGKYNGTQGDFNSKKFWNYDIVKTPTVDTVRINSSGDRVVEVHTIKADKIKILNQYFDEFNSLVLYKNRLVCTNAKNRTNSIIMSCSDDIFNFENNENLSGEAIKFTFPEAQLIYSAFEFKSLILFTSQGIWALDRNQNLTPLNIPFDEILSVPPASDIAPAKVGSKMFYVNKSKSKIFMLEYVTSNEIVGFKTLDTTTLIENELKDIEFICPVQIEKNDGYSIMYVQTKTQSYVYTIISEEQIQHWTKLDTSLEFEHYQFFGDDILYFGKDGKVYKIQEVPTDEAKITLLKPYGQNKKEELISFDKTYIITGMKILVRGKYDIEIGKENQGLITKASYSNYLKDDNNKLGELKYNVFNSKVGLPVNVSKNRFSKGFTDVRLIEISHITAEYDDDIYIKMNSKEEFTILGIELEIETN